MNGYNLLWFIFASCQGYTPNALLVAKRIARVHPHLHPDVLDVIERHITEDISEEPYTTFRSG